MKTTLALAGLTLIAVSAAAFAATAGGGRTKSYGQLKTLAGASTQVPDASGRPVGDSRGSGRGTVVELNEGNFNQEALYSKVPVVVDFYATWCGPCKEIAPILEELAADYGGRVKFGRVDAEKQPGLAKDFSIKGYPTLLLLKNNETRKRIVGLPASGGRDAIKRALADAIETYLLNR